MISMCSSAVCGCLCGHQVRALANLPALYHVVIYRDCKRYFHDYALFLGNIDPCHIVHANRSSSWICFGGQPFHHCRSNLFDDTGAPRRWLNLHKSNAANERLADRLRYGRNGPWRCTSGQDALILTALATMRKKTRLAAVP